MRKYLFKHRRIFGSLFLTILIVGVFGYADSARAQFSITKIADDVLLSGVTFLFDRINDLLTFILYLIIQLFSFSAAVIRFVLVESFDLFNLPQVTLGWRIVRDTMNSFFIVVLIAIAISTIIRFQQFNFRSTLPRLILAAFLVNFSRTICLVAINASNSLMQTFGNAVADALPILAIGLRLPAIAAVRDTSLGNLFGLAPDTFQNAPTLSSAVTVMVTLIFGIFVALVALGAIAFFAILLVFRVIVLWFLMILSPLAFFLWGTPGRASSYWGQWLNEFVQHLLVGPVAAFFLYIVLSIMIANVQTNYGANSSFATAVPQGTGTIISHPQIMFGYLTGLGMMFIALEIIQQMGVRGGAFAERVGVDGIIKGGLRGAKSLAGYANNYLYSKGLSVRPGAAMDSIRAGVVARNEQWLQRGRETWSERAKSAEHRASGVQALLYAAAGENSEVFEKNGLLQVARRVAMAPVTASSKIARRASEKGAYEGFIAPIGRTVKGAALGAVGRVQAIPGAARAGWAGAKGGYWDLSAGTDDLYAEADKLQAREEIRAGINDVMAGGGAARYGGDTGAVIQSRLEAAQKQKSFDNLASVQSELSAARAANSAAATAGTPQPHSAEKIDDLVEAEARLTADVAGFASTAQSRADVNDLQKLEEVSKFMNDARYAPEIGGNTLNSVLGALGPSDPDRKQQILGAATTRMLRGSVAVSGVRSDLALKAEDYQNKRFKDFEEYDPVDLAQILLGHMNASDVPEFFAVLRQAGKQANLGDLMENVHLPGVDNSREGFDAFMQHAKQRMDLSDSVIAEFRKGAQGYATKNDEYDFSYQVKAGSGGKVLPIKTSEAREKAVKKMSDKGAAGILRIKTEKLGKIKRGALVFKEDVATALLKDLRGLDSALRNNALRGETNVAKINGLKKLIQRGLADRTISLPEVDSKLSASSKKLLGL